MTHYHVVCISPGFNLPQVLCEHETTAFLEFLHMVEVFFYMSSYIPDGWNNKRVQFVDGTVIRWYECKRQFCSNRDSVYNEKLVTSEEMRRALE